MDNIEIANNYYNENLKGKIPGIVALHTNKLASAINGAEPTGEITPINEYLEYFTKSDYLYTDKLPHKARESMMQTASMDFPNVCTAKVPLLFGKEILLIDLNDLRILLNEKELDISVMADPNDSKKSIFAVIPYVKEQSHKM